MKQNDSKGVPGRTYYKQRNAPNKTFLLKII